MSYFAAYLPPLQTNYFDLKSFSYKPFFEESKNYDEDLSNVKYSDILIFPINLEKPNPKKSKEFFDNLKIKNLSIYFDPDFKLTKQFQLRGIPTTILINKEGKEFARIIGEIDFNDKKFVEWLRQFI